MNTRSVIGYIASCKDIYRLLTVLFVAMLLNLETRAQQVDLGNLKNTFSQKPVRIGGGISANTIFYDGNDGQGSIIKSTFRFLSISPTSVPVMVILRCPIDSVYILYINGLPVI
jgi:hypothetical protein